MSNPTESFPLGGKHRNGHTAIVGLSPFPFSRCDDEKKRPKNTNNGYLPAPRCCQNRHRLDATGNDNDAEQSRPRNWEGQVLTQSTIGGRLLVGALSLSPFSSLSVCAR